MQKGITTFHLETSLEYTVKLEIPFLKRRNCVAIVKICDWPHRPLLSSFSLIFFFIYLLLKMVYSLVLTDFYIRSPNAYVTANNLIFVLKTKIHALCRCFLELSMLIFTNV